MWKFQHFSITQILREVNFGECKSSKTAVFAIFGILEVQNLPFYYIQSLLILIFVNFFIFWRLKCTKRTKVTTPKMSKRDVFALQESSKLTSRKIWVIEKSWNFHTLNCAHIVKKFPWKQLYKLQSSRVFHFYIKMCCFH